MFLSPFFIKIHLFLMALSLSDLASFAIDGNGDYNSLLSLLSNLTIIFVQWFCTLSFVFTSAFVSQNFREYGTTVYF